MTEERLKQIKVSLDFQVTATKAYGYDETLLNEEIELYNEVIRLREENEKIRKQNMYEHKYGSDMEGKYIVEKAKNDKAIKYIEKHWKKNHYYEDIENCMTFCEYDKNDLLNILKGE